MDGLGVDFAGTRSMGVFLGSTGLGWRSRTHAKKLRAWLCTGKTPPPNLPHSSTNGGTKQPPTLRFSNVQQKRVAATRFHPYTQHPFSCIKGGNMFTETQMPCCMHCTIYPPFTLLER